MIKILAKLDDQIALLADWCVDNRKFLHHIWRNFVECSVIILYGALTWGLIYAAVWGI